MDQVGKRSLLAASDENDGRFHWAAKKSAPKVGGGLPDSVGKYNEVSNSSGKKSSEISEIEAAAGAAIGSSYNEAAGSQGNVGPKEAHNSLIGFELASCSGHNSSRSNSLTGNNGNANSSGNNKPSPSSYSKIFLQYLPHTLNLNSKRQPGKRHHSSGDRSGNCNSPDRRLKCNSEEIERQLVCDTAAVRSTDQHISKSRGIVGALSKFKISSSGQQQQPKQKLNHNKPVRSHKGGEKKEDEEEALFGGNSSSQFGGGTGRREATGIDSSGADQLIKPGFEDSSNTFKANNLELAAREIGSNVKIKRKGFLYLKRKSNLEHCEAALGQAICANVARAGNGQEEKLSQQVRARGRSSGGSKRRDLNNNSISSFLGSNGNQHNEDDEEHNRCLLDCEEEEEDYPLGDRAIESTKNKADDKQADICTTGYSGRQEGGRQTGEQNNNNTFDNYNKLSSTTMSNRYIRKKSSAEPKASILAGGLMLLALCAILTGAGKLAFAQQQQPFSRSQQPGGSLSPAPLPAGGGAQTGSGANRPAPQPAAGSLVANINCNKIKGHVTLTPNLQGGTTVSTQISAGPPGEVYQWSVHQFPVKPGAAMCSCSPMILGSKLIDLSEMHGNLPSDQEFNVQSSLSLFGAESPVGHSLMLRGMKTGMVACATFLPTSRKSNYRAKFHTPISGSVTIFQTAFGTSFIAHLMYSNGTRRHSMHRFDLVKSEDDMVTTSLLGGLPVGGPMSAGSRAESLALEQREFEHELTQCRRYAQGEPLFRNMSYQLAVSTENFGMRGRTAMVLPQIPFETFASVFVIIYSEWEPSEPIACAPLKFVKPKTAAAKFQSVSVQGSVVFSQDSPYDVTVARINLNLPNSDGHSYGIDELPMIIRRKSDTRVCPNIREIIYNPHHVEPSSVPPEGEATSDQYAVGDLSGKYGSLTGKASEKIQVNDFNLPLYGPISIVGRAMTIYSAEGVAIACSNVELTTPMTTAFATFDFGIQGQFIFRQPVNDCNGDTYVYIEVSKPVAALSSSSSAAAAATGAAGSQQADRSLDHNWHIHVSPVDSGLDHLSTTDCSPAGPHFNPYNTSTSSIYSRDCTPFNVLRCELGDMSSKMFTIEIPPYKVKGAQEPDIGKFFGTDIDLPLCGPVSIVNRSVVVHGQDFGHQRLACSTVIEFKPRSS